MDFATRLIYRLIIGNRLILDEASERARHDYEESVKLNVPLTVRDAFDLALRSRLQDIRHYATEEQDEIIRAVLEQASNCKLVDALIEEAPFFQDEVFIIGLITEFNEDEDDDGILLTVEARPDTLLFRYGRARLEFAVKGGVYTPLFALGLDFVMGEDQLDFEDLVTLLTHVVRGVRYA
jgi:hypothetical protein